MRELSMTTLHEQVAALASIPVEELTDTSSLLRRLPQLEEEFRKRLIGQDAAVDTIMQALRSRLLRDSATRPILNLLCVGPSGVGKTETALQLARICFGSPESLVRLDGSEYNEKHSIARLIGAPPGYIGYGSGGQLTEAVRRRPRSVVLFDEVEKAAPEVLNALLQVTSAGRLTDSMGQTVDYRRAMVILTSNLGNKPSDTLPEAKAFERTVKDAVRTHFPPEFLGRLDALVVYQHLSPQMLERIVRLKLADLAQALRGVAGFEATDEAIAQLAKEALSPNSGARQVDQVLSRRVEPAIVQMAEKDLLDEGHPSTIRVRFEEEHYVFDRI